MLLIKMKIFDAFCQTIGLLITTLLRGADGFSLRTEAIDEHYTSMWYNYSIINENPIKQTDITFEVKACKEARVILAESYETLRPSYEVIIDKDSRYSRFRSCSAKPCINDRNIDTHNIYDILSCQTFRSFWISWNGELRFGLGSVIGVRAVLSQQLLTNINIKYIGLVTITGTSDEWIFNEDILSFNISVNKCRLHSTPVINVTNRPTHQSPVTSDYASLLSYDKSTATTEDVRYVSTDKSKAANEDTSVLSTDHISVSTTNATYPTTNHSSVASSPSISASLVTKQSTQLQCKCPCRSIQHNPLSYIYGMNLTHEEIRAELKQELIMLKERIHIDPKMTKKYNSTKTSATDNRFSSRVTGLVGCLVLLFIVGILITFDLITIFS